MIRSYEVQEPDPVAVARAFGIALTDVGIRLGVTGDYVRKLARSHHHAARVRRVVLELALEHERLREVLR